MKIAIIIFIVLLSIIGIFIILGVIKNKKLMKKFRGKYFDFDDETFEFERLSYIRKYWDLKKQNENPKMFIDDTTWNDLDMNFLFFKMNANQTSIGEEYLYSKLREVNFDLDKLKHFGDAIDFMNNNESIRAQSLCALYDLGKNLYNGVHEYIFNADKQLIKNMYIYYIHASLPVIGIIISIFTPIGFLMLLLSFIINSIFYYKNKFKLDITLDSITYIKKSITCAETLSKIDYKETNFHTKLKAALHSLKGLVLVTNNMFHTAINEFEALFEYIKIIFMIDFINYNRVVKTILKHTEEFHDLYKTLGEIDSTIAISQYRKTLPFYSYPKFNASKNIILKDIYHPLIKNCVENSIDLNKNIILTGSNASGKSTFIKALAISIILSQNIYMTFTKEYSAKMSWVITSMAVKDNIVNNESYFIAEIKSLRRILKALNDDIRIVCFIDEILKGTNTIERVAASSSVLNFLSHKNCLVVTASHDMELTEILSNIYDNYHFRETITDDGIVFDYILYRGYATTKNAIKLLEFMEYDKDITLLANELANDYMKNRKWKKTNP